MEVIFILFKQIPCGADHRMLCLALAVHNEALSEVV